MHEGPEAKQRGGWPTKIGDLLPGALDRLGPRGVWTEAKLRKVWLEVVGPDVAAHANVGRLRGTTLEVWTDGDSWATELRYLGATIVERLNARLGPGVVTELVARRRRGEGAKQSLR